MSYTLVQRIKMFICRLFNHFPKDSWEFNGTHANCRCCHKVITLREGGWK